MLLSTIFFISIFIIFLGVLYIYTQKSDNKKISAPKFSVKYQNPQQDYTGWTATISPNGNQMFWTSFDDKVKMTWNRAKQLTTDQDPTIISGGEVPMSNLPSGYTNKPETGITTYNWLNPVAKWPVLITNFPNTSNKYYIKQGTHYDPNIDVLITN